MLECLQHLVNKLYTNFILLLHKSVHILLSLTTVVNVRWVVDSVSVKEGVDQTVSLSVVSEGLFAHPISIGVACSPVRVSYLSAGNVFIYVCI